MTALIPRVQIFKDVPEKVSSVSLRRDLSTGTYVAVMRFQTLASLAHFRCFGRRSGNALHLIDTEGEILIEPFIKMVYGGPEGEDIRSVECKLEIDQDAHWARLMRFIHRYADVNGLAFKETKSGSIQNYSVADNRLREDFTALAESRHLQPYERLLGRLAIAKPAARFQNRPRLQSLVTR